MALITCKDCQQKFSTDAGRCPHCGATRPISKKLLWAFCGATALVVFSSFLAPETAISPPASKTVEQSGGSNARADDAPLKPEMSIRFAQGTLGCLSKDDLQEATVHALKGERTKLDTMMVQNGGSCVMLPPNKRVKIISVEYNDPGGSDIGLVEVVGEGITAGAGAWAFSVGAEPVISKNNRQ